MDRDELALFASSLRRTAETHTGAALDDALDELGWSEALDVVPAAAVSALFEAQGAAGASSSALGRVLASSLGFDPALEVVLPALDSCHPPGVLHDERLRVRGLVTAAALRRETLLIPSSTGEKDVAVTVDTSALSLRPVRGLDPRLELVEVLGDDVPLTTAPEPIAAAWSQAVARGQLAVAHELVGAGRTMLELARTHAVDRVQFGRPISGFQAVRHRLADTLVALEAADALVVAAWEDTSPDTAAMAKALAGRGARTAARHCQQVLAGIGFTTEHQLHLYVRRTFVLDLLLGSARTLTRELGHSLLTSRQLPAPLPL